jgi:hypothetical protein
MTTQKKLALLAVKIEKTSKIVKRAQRVPSSAIGIYDSRCKPPSHLASPRD